MSNTKNTGGPAFPTAMEEHVDGILHYDQPGMTLRDHFAGLAMQQFCNIVDDYESAAEWAYKQADAMLKAREQ
jgi:hypothetical protein